MRPFAAVTFALSLLTAHFALAGSAPLTREELEAGTVVEGVVTDVMTRSDIRFRPDQPPAASNSALPIRREYTIRFSVAASRGPSAPDRHTTIEVHGWDMASGPAGGVEGIKDLERGSLARLFIGRDGEGAPWTVREPNGVEHLSGN